MTAFDYAVLAILLISIVVSVLRGLVREILSLIGWVAAFVVASMFAETVAPYLTMLPSHPVLRTIVAFLLLLLGMALVMATERGLSGLAFCYRRQRPNSSHPILRYGCWIKLSLRGKARL